MTIGRAYTPDVTVENEAQVSYVSGSEETDGSVRMIVSPAGNLRVQKNKNKVWNSGILELDAGSLLYGQGVSSSVLGDNFVTTNRALSKDFMMIGVPFDSTGSGIPRSPVIGPLLPRIEIQEDFSVERVTQLATRSVFFDFDLPGGLVYGIYLKPGPSAPATADLVFRLVEGFNGEGEEFFTFNISAEDWAFGAEVRIPTRVGFFPGSSFQMQLISGEDFSVLGSAISDLFVAVDFQDVIYEESISHPSGTNRFVSDSKGDLITDSKSNLVLSTNIQPVFLEEFIESTFAPPFSDPPSPPPPGP